MKIEILPKEPVIFAEDFQAMVLWYKEILHLEIIQKFEDDYHYYLLSNKQGVKIGIADAKEMGVTPGDRKQNTVVLQFQVNDVKEYFEYLNSKGTIIALGPSFDEKDKFWYGGFNDLEGNPIWVVDLNCP